MKPAVVASFLFLLVSSVAANEVLRGVVKKADGTPAAGVHVSAMLMPVEAADDTAEETESDSSGAFAFKTLAPGTYTIGASSPDLAAGFAVAEVKAGAVAEAAIVVGGEARPLSGAVTGPGVGAHVLIVRFDVKQPSVLSVPVRNGHYTVALPRGGQYAMQAMSSLGESQGVRLLEDEKTRDLTIERTFKKPPEEVGAWIAKNAIPLKSVQAGNGFDDMRPIRALVGDARLVALGEATHGSREFFQFKHRMLEYLVSNAGFDVFLIEASFPDALAVNDYVVEGKGDAAAALSGMQFWTWETEEVLALIKWMRAWNEEPSHARKIRFYGFDMQNPEASVRLLRKYLEVQDAAAIPLLDPIAPALGHAPAKTATEEERSKAIAALDSIAARLDAKRGDDRQWLLAREQVTLIRQGVRLFAAKQPGIGNIRDAAMAENIAWIMEHEPKGTKAVLWAHNGHVSTEIYPFAPEGTMGSHVKKTFGRDLVVMGAAFNAGKFQATGMGKQKGLIEHAAEPLDPGTFDRTLADSGPPLFVLDLRKANGVVREWLDSPLKNRSIGSMYDPDRSQNFVMTLHPLRSFDAVYFVRDTTSAIPLGGRQPVVTLPPPAPAAVNLDFTRGIEGWQVPPSVTEAGYHATPTSDSCVVAPCVAMKCDPAVSSCTYGTLLQRIDATPYRGEKVRFHAKVRSKLLTDASSGRIFLRVDTPNGVGFFDGMETRAPASLPEWTDLEIVGDVAKDAAAITFGGMFGGSGTVWFDEMTLEVVKRPE